jgi:hypothetical protein
LIVVTLFSADRMIRRRVSRVRSAVKERLLEGFVEQHTPREVAFSFSLGVFITALPSLGTGCSRFSSSPSC